MSPICWTRIDERLIHGQVVVAWRRYLGYDEICVVDDAVAGDPFLSDVLRLAGPDGVAVRVCTVQGAAEALASRVGGRLHPALQGRILLLCKHPQTVLDLVEAGLLLSQVNVGNLSGGSIPAMRSISLSPEDVAALDALAEHGVRITFQPTPDDPEVDWQVVRRRHF